MKELMHEKGVEGYIVFNEDGALSSSALLLVETTTHKPPHNNIFRNPAEMDEQWFHQAWYPEQPEPHPTKYYSPHESCA